MSSPMHGRIPGAWTLRSFHLEDVATGERSEPFGSEPRGTLILHPDGRMAALITAGGWMAPTTAANQTGAFQKLVAYAGRYRLEPPNRLVTTVDVASIDAWVGTDQTRTYALEGDNLTLFTPPGRMPRQDADEVTVVGTLSWTREPSRPVEGARQVAT